MAARLRLGALGGPNTFGAEAAHQFLELYPIFNEVVYFATSEEALRFQDGRSDAFCVPQQMSRSGPHQRMQVKIADRASELYVLGEVTHAYRCSLLVKPGTPRESIRRVLGHTGSVTQCRDWLEVNVPQAEIVIVSTNSMGAAEDVIAGDGSTASIGTPGIARQFDLEQLYADIDGHSVGAYWALSPLALFSERPDRVVIAGRFGGEGRLSPLIVALAGVGLALETVFSVPSGARLYEYDYALRFGGGVALADLTAALASFPEARLAGAFESRV